ncbi:putative secreted protein [Methylobacterium aerolatum]|uniref:Secreted protein n=2 Tax=Methylobacterium aerolatum TaxID=418708 RepID=A0ABU0I0A0_9HYPH|nr:putative secreted protein [Methylobacterium aerolatum]
MSGLMQVFGRSTPATLGAMTVLVAAFVAVGVSLFKLTVAGGVALYFVIWWTLLFAILPIRNQAETRPEHIVPGQDPGAPARPRLREKAIWTTLLAGVVFLGALAVFPLAGL